MNYFDCLGVKVSETTINKSVKYFFDNFEQSRNKYICCANAHTVVFAYENKEYKYIMNRSFLVLPDGGPIANRGGKEVQKVSGVDFFENVLESINKYKCFFYGNNKKNLNKLIDKIKGKYPGINICGFEESKFRDLSNKEKEELKKKIVNSKADIVWVGLGAPKQEIFCSDMCRDTNACWIAIGGAFNIMADIVPRAPKWMQKHSLEWLYRFIKEPKRLFKRYFIGNAKYIWYSIEYGWKKKN